MTIETVIAKLHATLNPNSKVDNNEIDMIIDIFWKEFERFQNKTGAHGLSPGRFLLLGALNGNQHELY